MTSIPDFIPTVVLIVILVSGWAVWSSPKGCDWLAQLLKARAAGLRSYRDVFEAMRPKPKSREQAERPTFDEDGFQTALDRIMAEDHAKRQMAFERLGGHLGMNCER